MPSPFPGMNPYLERDGVWHDFHTSFVPAIRDSIAAQVLPAYFVTLEEHLYVEEPPRPFFGRGDVTIKGGDPFAPPANRGATAVIEAPFVANQTDLMDTFTEPYLEIRDREDGLIVTVIELLSPTNKKPGENRDTFLAKRRQYMRSDVNYVEIDLLRGWDRMPIDDLPACDYAILVKRSEDRPRVGLWPLRVRDPLPVIPIPLRSPDPDARLDLMSLLHQVYDRAGYRYRVYSGKLRPPLMPDDVAWSDAVVAEERGENGERRTENEERRTENGE